MSESKRQLKVARQLQKDLSDILRKKLGDQFRNAILTITRVEVSADLSVAKFYLSLLAVDKTPDLMGQIESRKGEIRKALGMKIGKQVRKVPELVFIEDTGARHASDIEDLLSKLNIPPLEE